MLKRAIGMLVALTLTIGSTPAVFAENLSAPPIAVKTSVGSYEDSDLTKKEQKALEQAKEEAEAFAIENEDPQYGKYLASLESLETAPYSTMTIGEEAGGGPDYGAGYSNNNLIHNSRYDKMDKIWGVDVSYYQYDIDWKKVKAAGIDFAIIRVGYRGYGTGGQLVLDYKFETNIKNAIAAGLDVGVYFYTQAINTKEAKEEADFVYKYIKNYDLDLPVFFDIESVDYDQGRLDNANLSKSEKTALCEAFCERMKNYGYKSGVYANPNWLNNHIDGPSLGKKYPMWLANYTNKASYYENYDIWQFSSTGKISGINTAVDMNVWYRDPNYNKLAVGKVENLQLVAEGLNGTLTWDAADNAKKYEIYRYDPIAKSYTKIITTTAKKLNFTLADGYYGYCVRAYTTVDGKTSYGDYSDIIYTNSDKIANLTARADETTVSLAWAPDTKASGYQIYYAANGSSTFTMLAETTASSYTVKDLNAATNYSFKVRAYYNSNGSKTYGGFSSVVKTVTKPAKMSAPKLVSESSDSLKVSWTALSGASGYQVAVYNASTGSYDVKATVGSSVTTTTISGLSASTSYRVAVRAYVANGSSNVYGNYSDDLVCQTAAAPPTGVYATVTPSNVTVEWNKLTGAQSYTVYKKSGSSYQKLGTTTELSYTFKDTVSGTANRIYVVSAQVSQNGKTVTTGYSSECVLDSVLPKTPSFTSYSATSNSLTLNWGRISGVTGYRLYKYDDSKKTYVTVKTISGDSSTSYTVTDLSPSQTYKFKVKAYKKGTAGISWGSASSVFSADTKSVDIVPGTPDITKSYVSGKNVTLYWTPVENSSGYRIYRYDDTAKTYVSVKTLNSGSTDSYTFDNSAGSTKFKVKAYNRNGAVVTWGKASAAYSIAKTTVPATPVISSASSSGSKITLKWSKISDASGYRIYRYDNALRTYRSVKTISGGSNNSYTLDAVAGTNKFKVKAYNKTGTLVTWGTASAAYSVSSNVSAKAPGTPLFLSYSSNADSVDLSWTSVPEASGYRLYVYDNAAGTYKTVKTLNGGSNCSYSVTGLTSGNRYRFKVKAYTRYSGEVVWGIASSAYDTFTAAAYALE